LCCVSLIFKGGAPVFNWHEIRKRKRKGSKTRPHSSPDPSCGREESRGGAIPFPQKNSLPRRVQISFRDFRQKMFELRPKNTALVNKMVRKCYLFVYMILIGGKQIKNTVLTARPWQSLEYFDINVDLV
jgi:hypothetical protein